MKNQNHMKYELVSPLDNSVIGVYQGQDEALIVGRVARQRSAATAYARMSVKERLKLLCHVRNEFSKEAENFVERTRRETGKPLPEIYGGEIIANLELFDFYLKNAERILRNEAVQVNKLNYPGKSGRVEHVPLGVVGVLSSWNYPVALALRAIIPALVAGNAVAFKPSEQSSSTGELIAEIFQRHFPENVIEVYYGGKETNIAIIKSVDKINFIGSVATGRAIAILCAERLIPCSTELSGKDAAIVLDDADIERATNGIIWGAFTNGGQNCASVERLYVQKGIAKDFTSLLVEKVKRLRTGDDVGPLRNEQQMKLVEKHLRSATAQGRAKILTGGKRLDGTLYFQPTVLEVQDDELDIMRHETFGPTLPVRIVSDLDEAIWRANDCAYGLTVSVWSSNIAEVQRRAREFEVGVVTINNCVFTGALASAPWGGVKETGCGVTNSKYGLLEMTRPMFVLTDKNKKSKEPWWFPYNATVIELMRTLVKVNSGKPASLLKALPLLNRVLKQPL